MTGYFGVRALGYQIQTSTRVPTRVLVYLLGNPGDGNLSSPKTHPLGSIWYVFSRKSFFKTKMLSHASHPTSHNIPLIEVFHLFVAKYPGDSRVSPGLLTPITVTGNTSYSPSIWAPGARLPGCQTGTRVLPGYPPSNGHPGIYPPKMTVNTRKSPGIFYRSRWVPFQDGYSSGRTSMTTT